MNTMKKLPLLIPVLLLVFAACKKEQGNVINPFANSNVTEVGSSPLVIPANATGALYTQIGVNYFYSGGVLDSATGANATAWFGNIYNPVFAGQVIINGDTLVDSVSYPWGGYNPREYGPNILSNAVTWSVSGNTTDSIPAFTHTDNTPFPVITGLSIPATIRSGTGITIRYHVTGAYDYIYYWLDGGEQPGKNDITFTGDSLNTASFSPVQIEQVIGTGNLFINVYVGKLVPYTVAGKTFYFVKESDYQLSTTII